MKTSSPQSARAGVGSISRRAFLKGMGTAAATAVAAGTETIAAELEQANRERVLGPGEVPLKFLLNGVRVQTQAEPRETLLDVLRNRLGYTGAKEGCDRATCGACTVLLGGKAIYACMKLAIDADGASIETIEGQARDGELTRVQQAFVEADGLQCGFCTPGFVMSVTSLLRENPQPAEAEVRAACAGHVCRCGSHPRIVAAALEAAGVKTALRAEIVSGGPHHG